MISVGFNRAKAESETANGRAQDNPFQEDAFRKKHSRTWQPMAASHHKLRTRTDPRGNSIF